MRRLSALDRSLARTVATYRHLCMTKGNIMNDRNIVTAAMLAIGDELLSGRTKDKNIGHLADMLTLSGIDLKEVRIVADDEDAIVDGAERAAGADMTTSSHRAVSVRPMTTSPPMPSARLSACPANTTRRR